MNINNNFANILDQKIVIFEDELLGQREYYFEKLNDIKKRLQQSFHHNRKVFLSLQKVRPILDSTGAVTINIDDFEKANPVLKEFFLESHQERKVRYILLEKSLYLRGLNYYLTRTQQPTSKIINTLGEEILQAQATINKFLTTNSRTLNYIDKRLLLAILDNKKHHMLELLHAAHQSERYLKDGSGINLKLYKNIVADIQQTITSFYRILLSDEVVLKKRELTDLIHNLINYLNNKIAKSEDMPFDIDNYLIKMYREANHPYEIGLLSAKLLYHYKQGWRWDYVIGVEYGGIEIPFVLNAFLQLEYETTIPHFFINATFSSYLAKHLKTIQMETSINTVPPLKGKSILLVDDNIVTGRTLRKAVEYAESKNVFSVTFACIGFSTEELFPHMVRKDHGCINPAVLEKVELLQKAQFLYRKEKGDYYRKGVFNPVEEKVERYLLKTYPHTKFKLQAS